MIFGLPDDADWQDEKNWYKANPSLGLSLIHILDCAIWKMLSSTRWSRRSARLRMMWELSLIHI